MARTTRFTQLIAALTACAGLTIGCGTQNSPVASTDDTTLAPSEAGRSIVAFAPGAIQLDAPEGRTLTQMIDPDQPTTFVLQAPGTVGLANALEVKFTVPAGTVTTPQPLALTLYGSTLQDLAIAFDGAALNFAQGARLQVTVGAQRVVGSVATLQVFQQYFDGTLAQETLAGPGTLAADQAVIIAGDLLRFLPQAPTGIRAKTLSRYSMGGGWLAAPSGPGSSFGEAEPTEPAAKVIAPPSARWSMGY